MARISVIIPARDVVEYLHPCLDDLRRQTFTDFEALVVDDGSTDGTPEVIDHVTRLDGRFRGLETNGEGPSVARNHGLDHAAGHMLAFVDADDRLSPHYLSHLHASLERTGSALACGRVRRLKGFETSASGLHERALGGAPRHATHIGEEPDLVYDTTIWNKLFLRSLWDDAGIRFAEGRWINDIFPSLQAHVLAEQVDLVADVVYYWRMRAARSSSITGSKFHDPQAALKSLEDRFDALDRSRRLLIDVLDRPAVVAHFDERVLWHDLWAYLALYPNADPRYRDTFVRLTSDFLTRHDIDPSRHRLGVLLHDVYRALLDEDLDRLDDLLDPRTRVVASGAGGRVQVRVSSELARQRGLLSRARSRLRHGSDRPTESDRLEATLRIRRVELDPDGSSPLRLVGEARIQDGRTAVDGSWRIRVGLDAIKGSVYLEGPEEELEESPTTPGLHPMMAGGWRSFTACIDPTLIVDHPDERRWQVVPRLQVDDTQVSPRTSLTRQALRTFGGGRPLEPTVDVVPTPSGPSGLQLRREDAPLRLLQIRGGRDLAFGFVVGDEDGRFPGLLWLQHPDGTLVSRTTDFAHVGGHVEASLAGSSLPADWERLELWTRAGGEDVRVRALSGLRTTVLPSLAMGNPELHAVCRPTVRGRVVLEAAHRRREIEDLDCAVGAGPMQLELSGRLAFPLAKGESLEARCRWTNERSSAPLLEREGRWIATLPFQGLRGEEDGEAVPRRWTLHVIDGTGTEHPLQVPAEHRHRLPLVVRHTPLVARIEVGAESGSHLVISPAVA
jgi:glycosyltransferase involved in cell wall biosynthesis